MRQHGCFIEAQILFFQMCELFALLDGCVLSFEILLNGTDTFSQPTVGITASPDTPGKL